MKCEVTSVPARKEYGGVEVPLIRNLCTRCRAVVGLTPGHLAFGERAAGDWGGGAKCGLRVFQGKKNVLPVPGIEPKLLCPL